MKFQHLPVLLLALTSVAQARVQIVPESRGAAQLAPKSLSMKTEVRGRFARTTATWTFSNASKRDFEAEFVADAPRGAVVTGFAYYYKGERVVARIVEKLRAEEIYRGAIRQRRDPALAEMIQRNLFRARISPVAPGDDVRIETSWVQPLRFEKKGWIYEAPFKEAAEKLDLQSWSVEVDASDPKDTFTTNVGGETSSGTPTQRVFQGKGDSLPLGLELVFAKSGVNLAISNSGTTDYFALRAEPGQKVVLPRSATAVISDRTLFGTLVVGRMARSKGARAFGDVAEKLWVAAQIDTLSRNDTNRAAVIVLSTRYGLPSKWTSWLAIPTAERKRLLPIIEAAKRAQAHENLRILGLAMGEEIGAGRAKGSAFARMKIQFDANCKIIDQDPRKGFMGSMDERLQYYSQSLEWLGYDDGAAKDRIQKDIRFAGNILMRIRRIQPYASSSSQPEADSAEALYATVQLRAIAPFWVQLRMKGEDDTKKRALIARIYKNYTDHSKRTNRNYAPWKPILKPLATQWAQLKLVPQMDVNQVAAARARVEDAANLLPFTATERNDVITSAFDEAEGQQFSTRSYKLQEQLASEVVVKRENGERARQLRSALEQIRQRIEFSTQDYGDPYHLPLSDAIQKVSSDLQIAELAQPDNQQNLMALRTEFDRLKKFAAPDDVTYHEKQGREAALFKLHNETFEAWKTATGADMIATPQIEALKARLQRIIELQFQFKSGYYNPPRTVETEMRSAEEAVLRDKTTQLRADFVREQSQLRPNPTKMADLCARIDAIQKDTTYNKTGIDDLLVRDQAFSLNNVLSYLRKERAKSVPDELLIADLERRAIELQPFDGYKDAERRYQGGRNDSDPTAFGKLRVERIKLQAQREKLQLQQKKNPADLETKDKVAQLLQLENQLRVRMGDPLIAVAAPRDTRQIIAIFPDGDVKKLDWDEESRQWQARFDVPTYAGEGAYSVQILIVSASGKRQKLTMNFTVDLTAPVGKAALTGDAAKWNLTVSTDDFTNRVAAFTPWQTRLEMKRGADNTFAVTAAVPIEYQSKKAMVRLVLTDKAHNRTEISLDWK